MKQPSLQKSMSETTIKSFIALTPASNSLTHFTDVFYSKLFVYLYFLGKNTFYSN
jgi:hypothetical protein